MNEALGKLAFAAYREAVAGTRPYVPPWSEVPADAKQGWMAAADAVLDHHLQLRFLQTMPTAGCFDD